MQHRIDPSSLALSVLQGVPGTVDPQTVSALLIATDEDAGLTIIDCERTGNGYAPLSPMDGETPLWNEVAQQLNSEPDATGAIVLADHLVYVLEPGREDPARIFALSNDYLMATLEDIAPDHRFSESELHVVKQVAAGMALSEAAQRDGVSHETRRSQYKSVAAKLGIRTQSEFAAKLLARILSRQGRAARTAAPAPTEEFVELMRRYVPRARTFVHFEPSGHRHRYIEIGPADGRPVIYLHSQVLSGFTDGDIDILEDLGLRLIIPLRNGKLDSRAEKLDATVHMELSLASVELVRKALALDRIDIFGVNSGTTYALEYSKAWPEHVRSLSLAAAPVSAAHMRDIENPARRMRRAVIQLATLDWKIYSKVMDMLQMRLSNPETVRRFILGRYPSNSPDLAVAMAEFSLPNRGERARQYVQASIESLKQDYFHIARVDWRLLPTGISAAFFHGAVDPINPLAAVQNMVAELGNVAVHIIPGAGQLFDRQHFQPLFAAVQAYLNTI